MKEIWQWYTSHQKTGAWNRVEYEYMMKDTKEYLEEVITKKWLWETLTVKKYRGRSEQQKLVRNRGRASYENKQWKMT